MLFALPPLVAEPILHLGSFPVTNAYINSTLAVLFFLKSSGHKEKFYETASQSHGNHHGAGLKLQDKDSPLRVKRRSTRSWDWKERKGTAGSRPFSHFVGWINYDQTFFLWRFLRNFFLRLCLFILRFLRFRPQGIRFLLLRWWWS